MKKLLIEFGKERDLILYCDLHGHSRKKNIFMYGCGEKNDTRYRERVFPYLLEKAADVFNFADYTHEEMAGILRSVAIEKGFTLLMDENRVEDLTRMYSLYTHVDALPQMRQVRCARARGPPPCALCLWR